MNVMPALGRIKLLRQWAGIMDMSMDGSPFICKTDMPGLYLMLVGAMAVLKPRQGLAGVFAHTIAEDEPHEINKLLTLDEFKYGRHIDESGHGPWPNRH